jgi:hypothetical protein
LLDNFAYLAEREGWNATEPKSAINAHFTGFTMSPIPVANDYRHRLSPSIFWPGKKEGRWQQQKQGTGHIFFGAGTSGIRSGGQRVDKSLRTDDRRQAEILALPLVAEHKKRLFENRPRLVMRPYTLPPGEYTVEGERVIATEREIIYFKSDGALIRTEPNSAAPELVNVPMGMVLTFGDTEEPPLAELRKLGPVIDIAKLKRPMAVTKSGDDAILEIYLKNAKNGPVAGYNEREARAVWALYKALTNGKPLKDADRDDGRKLVAHFEAQGLKSGTIEKRSLG